MEASEWASVGHVLGPVAIGWRKWPESLKFKPHAARSLTSVNLHCPIGIALLDHCRPEVVNMFACWHLSFFFGGGLLYFRLQQERGVDVISS